MAGGSRGDTVNSTDDIIAAMEPRPDGRGKAAQRSPAESPHPPPQWSPGLMAGGRDPDGSPWESRDLSGDFERSQRRWVIAS